MLSLRTGDTRVQLKRLLKQSVHCIVTSPPYYGLRRYLPADDPNAIYEIGTEKSVNNYVANLVNVFRECHRVLRDDGVFWLNLGDSYNGGGMEPPGSFKQASNKGSVGVGRSVDGSYKHKDLMGIPWRLAFTLQNAGWYLRSACIWAKPNPMPESATDRCTSSYEMVFMLTKQPNYFYDAEAIKEEGRYAAGTNAAKSSAIRAANSHVKAMQTEYSVYDGFRNKRDVWVINKEPYADKDNQHFAVMPTELASICIKAGTSEKGCCRSCGKPWERIIEYTDPPPPPEGRQQLHASTFGHNTAGTTPGYPGLPIRATKTVGWQAACSCGDERVKPCTVLDPFMGAGTTLLAANMLGRNGVGIELNPQFTNIAYRRIKNDQGFFVKFDSEPADMPATRPTFVRRGESPPSRRPTFIRQDVAP